MAYSSFYTAYTYSYAITIDVY